MTHVLIRQVVTAGAIAGLVMLSLPRAALGAVPAAASPKASPRPKIERSTTVSVTDSGFDKQSYTVGSSWIPGNDEAGKVTFVNKGTKVHSATAEPGSFNFGVAFGNRTDAAGTVLPCFPGQSSCGSGGLNTGGIDPGGSVTLALAPLNKPVTYTFTSATDCLFGNSTPSFNCAPATIKVVGLAPATPLSGTLPGSVLRPAGSPDCIVALPPVIPSDGSTPFCYSAARKPGSLAGSPKKPVGDTMVKITDFGFDPTITYVKPDSTVTWVNAGTRVHTVQQKPIWSYPADGFHTISSGGLAPGQSYTYYFPAGVSANYQSAAELDIVRPSMNGGFGGPPCIPKLQGTSTCGQPAMIGAVRVVG